jgi:exopolyphosphatase / guanosine-5'-triphosphate,3'-diphosphate pyrophosphatase
MILVLANTKSQRGECDRYMSKSKTPRVADAGKALAYRIAAIDVGSTSVRMRIAEVLPSGERRIIERLVHPIALGADTFRQGMISSQTVRALAMVLSNFRQILAENDVATWRAVATSAVRDATNMDMALDRLHHDTGMDISVLSPVEESRLMLQTLRPLLGRNKTGADEYTLVLDVGGGSTEIMVLRGNRVVLGGSRRLGTSRLFHSMTESDCADRRGFLEVMIRNTVNSTRDLFGDWRFKQLILVNPMLRRLMGKENKSREIEGGLRLGAADAQRILSKALSLPIESLAERYGIGPADAERLQPALLIFQEFMHLAQVRRILFSEVDLLDGVLMDVEMGMRKENPLALFQSEIVGSVTGLMEKFHVDMPHSQQIRMLSLALYDGLAELLDLSDKDRLYMEVAALLHDIGRFVSDRDHHKHSMYIINWSEILGLDEEERSIVALIARYHRKGRPSPSHIEYASLPTAKRLKVSKLGSLLRLADALDRSHDQRIKKLHVSVQENTVDLAAESDHSLAVEESALARKDRLFHELTGMNVLLRRHTT